MNNFTRIAIGELGVMAIESNHKRGEGFCVKVKPTNAPPKMVTLSLDELKILTETDLLGKQVKRGILFQLLSERGDLDDAGLILSTTQRGVNTTINFGESRQFGFHQHRKSRHQEQKTSKKNRLSLKFVRNGSFGVRFSVGR